MSAQELQPTTSVHFVRWSLAFAAGRGMSPPELCARFGFTPEELADSDARVPAIRVARMWDELPALTGVSELGIMMAERVHEIGSLHLIAYVARACATVGEGIALALRYQRLLQDAVVGSQVDQGDEVAFVFEARDPAARVHRHGIEFFIAASLLLARRATGGPFVPVRVELRHPRPSDNAEACRVFACEIRYDAERNAVVLARSDLERPFLSADSELASILEERARAAEARLPAGSELTAKLRRVLVNELLQKDPTLEAVAARLRMTKRTLQRRLGEEGTTYQRVLDELRRDLAKGHLDGGLLGIQEIAFVLGFADQAAFTKAFTRWTGVAPGAYRKNARKDRV